MKEEQNMSYTTKMKTCLKQTGQLHTLKKNKKYSDVDMKLLNTSNQNIIYFN